jgi:hypothetical protein
MKHVEVSSNSSWVISFSAATLWGVAVPEVVSVGTVAVGSEALGAGMGGGTSAFDRPSGFDDDEDVREVSKPLLLLDMLNRVWWL